MVFDLEIEFYRVVILLERLPFHFYILNRQYYWAHVTTYCIFGIILFRKFETPAGNSVLKVVRDKI